MRFIDGYHDCPVSLLIVSANGMNGPLVAYGSKDEAGWQRLIVLILPQAFAEQHGIIDILRQYLTERFMLHFHRRVF
jgi:hypothetical protein